MKTTTFLAAAAAYFTACSAQSACYGNLAAFPASRSACYPTNYYRTSDLGQTSPSDAQTRCQQQCTSDTSCGSVVAQVNSAADQPNFYPSGTCFFYANGQTVAPRQCADTAYLLLGYQKVGNGPSCSSSSLQSSMMTSSSTTTTASTTTTTVTSTSTATSTGTTSSSTMSSSTMSSSTTSSSTMSSSTMSSSTMSSSTMSSSTTSSSTSTATSTSTSTTMTTSSTTVTSTTLSTSTSSVTATPTTTTTGTTTTTSTTSPATATIVLVQVQCIGDAGTAYNACGNNANCACEIATGGRAQCVNTVGSCGPTCSMDSDCALGQACLLASTSGCGSNTCSTQDDTDTCGATYTSSTLTRRGLARGPGLRRSARGSSKSRHPASPIHRGN